MAAVSYLLEKWQNSTVCSSLCTEYIVYCTTDDKHVHLINMSKSTWKRFPEKLKVQTEQKKDAWSLSDIVWAFAHHNNCITYLKHFNIKQENHMSCCLKLCKSIFEHDFLLSHKSSNIVTRNTYVHLWFNWNYFRCKRLDWFCERTRFTSKFSIVQLHS